MQRNPQFGFNNTYLRSKSDAHLQDGIEVWLEHANFRKI